MQDIEQMMLLEQALDVANRGLSSDGPMSRNLQCNVGTAEKGLDTNSLNMTIGTFDGGQQETQWVTAGPHLHQFKVDEVKQSGPIYL